MNMTYRSGSCVVCGHGTDTVLAFHGEAEWHIAALQVLGIPAQEVEATYAAATRGELGKVPVGEFTVQVRVCTACVEKSPFHPRVRPVLAIPGQEVPAITYGG
jgi:hypothetical protein